LRGGEGDTIDMGDKVACGVGGQWIPRWGGWSLKWANGSSTVAAAFVLLWPVCFELCFTLLLVLLCYASLCVAFIVLIVVASRWLACGQFGFCTQGV